MQIPWDKMDAVKEMRSAITFLRANADLIPHALNTMHRTEQQMVMSHVVTVMVKHWAKCKDDPEYCGYDGRNEVTVNLCSKILKLIGEEFSWIPII